MPFSVPKKADETHGDSKPHYGINVFEKINIIADNS